MNKDSNAITACSITGFEGKIDGEIIDEKRGEHGFGYDPIFVPEGNSKTFAEMNLEEKSKLSHRSIALEKFYSFLIDNNYTKK